MKKIPGNYAQLHEVSNVNHDFILAGNLTGYENEAQEAADVAQGFLEKYAVS